MQKLLTLSVILLFTQSHATELTDAIRTNDRHKIEQLLAQSSTIIDTPDSYGDTPLIHAVSDNKKELAHLLLENGADINKPNNNGQTPLHTALYYSNKELVQPLLQSGASPFIKDEEAKTALDTLRVDNPYWSSEEKQPLIELVEQYMRLFQEVQHSPTIDTLKKAVQLGYPGLVKQLLKKIKPNIKQIRQVGQLAQQEYNQTNNEAFTTTKRVLTDYMHALMLAHAEPGIPADILPADILHVIAGYAV
ncbi:ankyrin repeat domain-containing protein [Candidatus Dependentiae bacterium]|nr:ankyrin repeat domain-containing protein [Candidatus Dependentiae bacterium]